MCKFFINWKKILYDVIMNIIHKILYFMNEAVDNDEILYKDICFDERLPTLKRAKGINKSLVHLYDELKNAKRYIEKVKKKDFYLKEKKFSNIHRIEKKHISLETKKSTLIKYLQKALRKLRRLIKANLQIFSKLILTISLL